MVLHVHVESDCCDWYSKVAVVRYPDAWQVFILDSLATYKPRDGKDAESIVERVTPRLQHANCAVVLSAVKVSGRSCYPSCLGKHTLQSCGSLCVVLHIAKQATYIAIVMLLGNARVPSWITLLCLWLTLLCLKATLCAALTEKKYDLHLHLSRSS